MAQPSAVSGRPTGTVTLLFTDIEGSTRLLRGLGTADYAHLLADHRRLIREAVSAYQGIEIKTEGDAFFVVFPRAADAVTAAMTAQRGLASHEWPEGHSVAVRMGIHTGDVQLSDGDYVGMDVHRAARISAAAHGGQVLISGATRAVAASSLPEGVTLRDLGEQRLKDIDAPEHLYQLVVEGLRADFPPLRAQSARFELLPPEMSTFVGREAELERARELLAGTRLLTLTGPGGTGKTRLALRLARTVAGSYPDGAAFIALASLSEPRLVASTIRQSLGLSEQHGRSAVETIADGIVGREMLLVLDNFEQVAAAALEVAELLAAVPGLTVIATSRVPLHISGEQEFAVPPMSVATYVDAADLARLSTVDAVALFVQRGRAVRPEFQLTEENAPAVLEICTRLDGLPLAIELAASRIKLLPPVALLERLARALDFLQSSAADVTDRQRTLRGAIDWSYGLLGQAEQALFRRLSVFVGGFRLEDGEAVAAAPGPIGLDVLDGVATLVDNSLIRQLEEVPEVRFGMLETIREFGREQLEASGELDAVAEAHARRVASLVEAAEPHLTAGPDWLDRLEANNDNVRAAFAWFAEHDLEAALVMAGRIWRFWHLRGHLREATATVDALLERPEGAGHTYGRAKALIGLAGIVYWRVDFPRARTLYEEALSITRELKDEELEVEVLYSLAYVRYIEGDRQGADADFRAAYDLYQKQGNELMATWALESMGMVATMDGRHEAAATMLDESVRSFERLGDTFGLRNAIAVLSRALMRLERWDEARTLNRRVIELAYAQRDLTSVSATLHDAASLFAVRGEFEIAARLTGAANRIVEESGGEPPPELVNRIKALPTLERELSSEKLSQLLAEGRRLTAEEATQLALSD
jgi:predicted ATPase/class 3 adenylate cyclase